MYSRKYIRPTLAAASNERIERPSPPPDYAGVAFRSSEARTEQDYPETVIPAVDEIDEKGAEMPSESVFSESDGMNEDRIIEPAETDTTDQYWNEDPPYLEPESSWEPESSSEPERISAPPPSSSPRSDEASADEAEAPDPPASDGESASSPLKWLRELKMEDFLLLWLLLMLLYGESNEEIDLLLGLLLFAGR